MSPLLLLLACQPVIDATDDTGDAGDTAGAWDGSTGPYLGEAEGEAPAVDTAAVGAALDEVARLLLGLHAGPALEAYTTLAEDMDADCPEWTESDGTPYWYDRCTSAAGTTFDGYATLVPLEGYVDEEGTVYDGWQYYGFATITDATGRVFESRGGAGLVSAVTTDGALVSYTYMEAGFGDSAAVGTWLAEALDPSLTSYFAWYEEAQGAALYVDGVLTGVGGAVDAVVFDQLSLSDEALGGCAVEPTATVSVLDAEGQWIDLLFDGGEATAPGCDGCGTAWVQGVSAGEVCVDFSPLLDWTVSPWWWGGRGALAPRLPAGRGPSTPAAPLGTSAPAGARSRRAPPP